MSEYWKPSVGDIVVAEDPGFTDNPMKVVSVEGDKIVTRLYDEIDIAIYGGSVFVFEAEKVMPGELYYAPLDEDGAMMPEAIVWDDDAHEYRRIDKVGE